MSCETRVRLLIRSDLQAEVETSKRAALTTISSGSKSCTLDAKYPTRTRVSPNEPQNRLHDGQKVPDVNNDAVEVHDLLESSLPVT
jgi:hypothetical protein